MWQIKGGKHCNIDHMAEKSSYVLFVLFDGIHKKCSKPSEHLLLESKGPVILKTVCPMLLS